MLFWTGEPIPPGGLIFYTGSAFPQFSGNLFMTSLLSEMMHRFAVGEGNRVEAIERWWPKKYGRLRAIAQGLDGAIYVGTSNRDGRTQGDFPGSDFIYRLTPSGS